MSGRAITHRYEDPLEVLWTGAARAIGLEVRRSDAVFASTNGRGTLTLGARETLDADDGLAQMIFHELCHSLVQGPESFDREDWGLENDGPRDLAREHACLRVQAVLARRYGLGLVLAPTTEHRAFYDALGPDALAGDDTVAGDDASLPLARRGLARVERDPWHPHLTQALAITESTLLSISAFARGDSLLGRLEPATPPHPSGLYGSLAPRGTCGDCAWRTPAPCRQSGAHVDPRWAGCERWEPEPFDCHACGACCREGFDMVEVDPRDPFVARHPELLTRDGGLLTLRRKDKGRCPPLEGDGRPEAPYRCAVYEDRPKVCREFAPGGEGCLTARRKVGLSL